MSVSDIKDAQAKGYSVDQYGRIDFKYYCTEFPRDTLLQKAHRNFIDPRDRVTKKYLSEEGSNFIDSNFSWLFPRTANGVRSIHAKCASSARSNGAWGELIGTVAGFGLLVAGQVSKKSKVLKFVPRKVYKPLSLAALPLLNRFVGYLGEKLGNKAPYYDGP